MEGLLIFSQSNDLIYNKFNNEINLHLKKMAISHGLLNDESLVIWLQIRIIFHIN